MRLLRHSVFALLALGLVAGAAAGADLDKLRQKLAREPDPANRAKITVEIGDELLKQAARKFKDAANAEAESILLEYRKAVHKAYDDLVETGRDARRKPKGFKHLEIHLRQSRRRLDDMARPLPYEDRRPIEEAIEDLEELRLKLLGDLMQEDRKGSNGPERKPQ